MTEKLTPVEGIKARSNYLRGTIVDSLADAATGTLADDDTQLSKFHGFYQQDDRDVRDERTRQKLEPAHSFMIRVRVPGGIATPDQWLAMDKLATTHANQSIRLTTRQAFQFHGVIKRDLKPTIRGINDSLLDTIAACGDVNRNVMCTPLAELSTIHRSAWDTAAAISEHLTPKTRAYHEIWLDDEKIAADRTGSDEGSIDHEPIYGSTYLPRKFKIAVAIPPLNDVDIFAQDLGFIAIEKAGQLLGFNVTVGGGMGVSHGEPATYPRVADVIGFCSIDQAVDVAEKVVMLQRDFGDRGNRKHARLKYTIDDRGLDWFNEELSKRLGFELEKPRRYKFVSRGDQFGWSRDRHGVWNMTLFVPEGRVRDGERHRLLSGLRAIASIHTGDFRLTPNQNLIVAGIPTGQRAAIETLLEDYGISEAQNVSPMRHQALACVALPSCALAMAEAERYLPDFAATIDALLQTHGLSDEPISVRISGCPNGCSRPYLAEIALVGKAPGRYNLYLGGSADGQRLNTMTDENVDEARIVEKIDSLLDQFRRERRDRESFGDFLHRTTIAMAGAA